MEHQEDGQPTGAKKRPHAYFAARMKATGDPVMCRIDLCDPGGMLNLCGTMEWKEIADEDGEPTGEVTGDFFSLSPNDLDVASIIWSIWAIEVFEEGQ